MEFRHLWAKSWPSRPVPSDPPSAYLLPGHLASVLVSAQTIVERTGADQLQALGLDAAAWIERLRRIVLPAAAIHDIGKANDHFQRMLLTGCFQGLRHEWLSVWLVNRPQWRDALRGFLIQPEDFHILWWAIAGHHPAYGRQASPMPVEGTGSELVLLTSHADFDACREILGSQLGLSLPGFARDVVLSLLSGGDVFPELRRLLRDASQVWDDFPPDLRRFTAACKAVLTGCDVAGSALPKAGVDIEAWIERALAGKPDPGDLREIVALNLKGHPPRPFQAHVAQAASRVTLLRAGCGSGKTVAAYMWAANRCPGRKLFVCYPTTGTATEGYRDYLFDPHAHQGRAGARLFHGRAEIDLDIILGMGGDDDSAESWLRLDSLDTWSTPIASCTADAVLGLMQNVRRGLYAWPALAGAAFVFDEIHAYDDSLFGALLRFVRDLPGLPVLLMTASLPASRLSAIRNALSCRDQILKVIDGPADLERLPRYRRQWPAAPADPLPEVAEAVARGDRVLWICNTVSRAMAYADAAERIGLSPLRYHSRFRYEDRVQRHREVIEAFRNEQGILAVCTQVAEVSLNISADLLVTDFAPVPPMIQRLGRLNRRSAPPMPGQPLPPAKPFIVIEPDTFLPYATDATDPFAAARTWLQTLGSADLSQADLAQAWESLDDADEARPVPSAWLDGGPETIVRELRKGAPGITVVLSTDAERVRSKDLPLTRAALPMPPPPGWLNWRDWPQIRGCPVAPAEAIVYDRKRGAQWQKR